MYVLLHGAKKNLGDFLIGARCRALLAAERPDRSLTELPSWEPLDAHLDLLREAKAILILGGPGYQPRMWPGVYPLCDDLDRIPVPVIPMGLGWKGFPGDDATVETYRFSDASLRALRWMQSRHGTLGCRDHQSVEVLRRAGITGATMTGCPVWYHLPSLGQPMKLPAPVRRLVFTPAQRPLYGAQSLSVAEVLARRFPDAERVASFHRGIGAGDQVPADDAVHTAELAAALAGLGFRCEDVSGDLDRVAFYADSDLHVGYRVHAHIQFLSERRPSLLLHEDGRGVGVSTALGVVGVDAFARSLRSRVGRHLPGGALLTRGPGAVRAAPDAATQVDRRLTQDLDTGFARFAGVGAVIDAHHPKMVAFLRGLP